MSAPDGEQVTVFDLGDEFVFKHYFPNEVLFETLADHYDADEYRFSASPGAFEGVREELEGHGYDVEVIEEPDPFCVVVERYEPHADLLRRSVAHWTRRGHEFFLMPDRHAVERATDAGATPVTETDLVVGI